MRTFIGLNFNYNLKDELYQLQKNIKINSNRGSWVPKSNFHITLKFLGEIREGQIDQIDNVIGFAATQISPISIVLDSLGYFNFKNDQYGVLWVGIEEQEAKINKLYNIVEKEMKGIGFPAQRRKFSPHITLGRRIKLGIEFGELKDHIDPTLGKKYILENIGLIESEVIRGKRIYTPIRTHTFT